MSPGIPAARLTRQSAKGYELSYAAPFGVDVAVNVFQQTWVSSIWTYMAMSRPREALRRKHAKMHAMRVPVNSYWLP